MIFFGGGSLNTPKIGKSFGYRWLLDHHMKSLHSHEIEKNQNCGQCEKSFSCKQSLQRHIETVHSKIKRIKCENCEVAYTDVRLLRRHIIRAHDQSNEGQLSQKISLKKEFKCDKCDKYLQSKDFLKTHIKVVHDGEKNYKFLSLKCCFLIFIQT